MQVAFRNRREAGQVLASRLAALRHRDDVGVLALPRGGIPVAFEVAMVLGAPLDVFVVRKLGVPGHEELAMGAIASGGARVLNRGIIQALQIDEASVDRIAQIEEREIRRREALYRGAAAAPVHVKNRTVVVVDDGLATGSTMRAAVAALRSLDARRIVVAVPVAAPETCAEMANEADEVVCATTPEPFQAVGLWYEDFSQTSDEEVIELLDAARRRIIRSVIPPERWSEFAESYGAEHRAWLADISVAEPDGRERVVVHARPLEEIRLTGDAVRIALAGGDSWVAERPSTMAALDDAEGRHVGLAVDSRDGRRVVLAFRSPARPEMLDGYVPARG